MESSKLNNLSYIFKRYNIAHKILNESDLEIGGGHNAKNLKRLYFYIPLIIGSVIVLIGFIFNFILFYLCSVPFFLYAIYGISQINIAIKENRNTTIISNREIRISTNDKFNFLNSHNIENYFIKTEQLDDEIYISELLIKDIEKNEHLLLTLIDKELPILEKNMKFINDFIQSKLNDNN